MSRTTISLLLALSWSLAACSENPKPRQPLQAPNATVDTATGATITGRVFFTGEIPPAPIRQIKDDACGAAVDSTNKSFVVGADGGLKNCFVYISRGLENKVYPPRADSILLEQKGCEYYPRVFGMMAGEQLVITNDDATLHNVHAGGIAERSAFNLAQMSGAVPIRVSFAHPEVMIPFRCDVHPWMAAYGGVLTHPFFAVTNSEGRFSIAGVPPGRYTIEVWHEPKNPRGSTGALRQSQQIELAAKESKKISFTISAKSE